MSILFSTTPQGADIRPAAYLNGGWDSYVGACRAAGAVYDRDARTTTISLDGVPAAVEKLRAAGFDTSISAPLAEKLAARAASLKEVCAAAGAASEAMDSRLRSRGLALYPFQRAGVEFLRAGRNRLLADDMGLGKTIQALTALPEGAPALVVCPAVAKGVWLREAAKWRPDLAAVALKGKASFRWPSAGEIVITNYDVLPAEAPVGRPLGLVLIVDEAQQAKNPRTLRGRRVRSLAGPTGTIGGVAMGAASVWLLTGTPLENNGAEVFGLLRLFGDDTAEHLLTAPKLAAWMTENGKGSEVAAKLRPISLRRKKVDVLVDLPAKRRADEAVEIGAKDAAELDRLLADMGGAEALAALITASAAESEATANHMPGFHELSAARATLARAKIPAVLELVEEYEAAGEPVIVMSDHLSPVDALAGREGWAKLDGSVAPEKRTELEAKFQAGELKGLACSIRAAGVALTLTRASTMIFVDSAWNPAKNAQAEDRIYRIGQSRGVLVRRLVADHVIDARLAELCAAKEAQFAETIDALNLPSGAAPIAELQAALAELGKSKAPEASRSSRCENCGTWLGVSPTGPRCEPCGPAALLEPKPAPVVVAPAPKGFPNKFGGRCTFCIKWVEAGAGLCRKDGSSWLVYHPACEVDSRRRGPETPKEEWAAAAILQLAADDGDRARELNGVGFNQADSKPGHQYARRLRGEGTSPG